MSYLKKIKLHYLGCWYNCLPLCLSIKHFSFSGKNILFHVAELGKKAPVFADSSAIAQEILDSGYEFDVGKMVYNKFR